MMMKHRVIPVALVLVALAGVATTFAQRVPQRRESSSSFQSYSGNVRYDGKFVFVRMSYAWSGGRGAPWAHDYPVGEEHFLKILTSISNVDAHVDASSIMHFSDPELFKFPVAYLVEPGFWYMSESDVTNLRAYLQKGGFLIVDDFPFRTNGRIDTWGNFEEQMSRVFPEGKWIELTDASHPIFHSFFEVNSLDIVPMAYNLGDKPRFMALFEDNDPKKRMLCIANYQNDLSEFWEFSEEGRYLVQDSNEAYKVGVNQFIYGITH
jgi:Domain of unknown function (DUF4159)